MATAPQKPVFFTALTTAWLALAVVFAGIFVIEEHDHEHIDVAGRRLPSSEDCHICLEIQIAQRLIEAFGRLGISIAVIGFISCAGFLVKPQVFYLKKPIELKVRFNC
jgi:predicted transporter